MHRSNKPLVRNEFLITPEAAKKGGAPIRVGSPAWYAWLGGNEGFFYEGSVGHLTARRELRRGTGYWYGYRRLNGRLTKLYLGKPKELTWERLEQASAQLAGQLPLQQIMGGASELSAALASPSVASAPPPNVVEEVSSLPLTKIKPPALPLKLLARPRLTEAVDGPVTIICAPSGYGKTTLLNEWRQNASEPVAWASLDAEDNHPVRFWSTVILALQTVAPGLGQSWFPQLGSATPSSLPSSLSKVVVNLTNDIVRMTDTPAGPDRIGLVLDNYHHIQNSEIHTSIQNLLDHMPPALQLVLSSDTRPPLALGYMRAKGMVAELGPDDLRLTLDEGIEFLRQHTVGQQLAYSDMQALVKDAEGWITGLVLAASALDQQESRSGFMETFSGARALVRDFLTENVLARQPPEMQAFLVRTSILKQLTGSLCDAVTGQGGSAGLLANLCEERLFLERLEEADWYRYHTLFAEMLLARLQEQFPTEVRRLHRRAARWYRARNAPVDAIFHLLASKDWEEAAVLIESLALGELEQLGQDSRLLGWLQQLPEVVVGQHKTLLGVYVQLSRMALSPAEVGDILARMERSLSDTAEMEKTASAQEALTGLQRMRRALAADDDQPPATPAGGGDESVWQLLDGILECRRDYRRDLIRAEERAKALYETALARRHLYGILVAGGGWANLALSQGHLRRSEQIAQQALRQAIELRGELPGSASIALTALGNVYFMRNQVAQAHQLLARATEVDPNPTSTNELVTIGILRAKIQSAQGDNDAAFATIQAIRELHSRRPSSIWLDQDLIAYQELFRLRHGDLAAAERLLSEGVDTETNPFSALVRAEILIEQERSVAAEEVLNRLLAQYPHGSYMLPILRARVILAIALFDQRKLNQARQVMTEAAHLAAPEYFIRPFLDYGSKIAPLFSLILRSESLGAGTRSFVKGILTMVGHANGMRRVHPREEPTELAVAASISPREQEVLRMLSAGLSNREIAERYSISTSTVKTHIESIFRKLGVSSRTQAIAEGKRLDLI
jgi:LuxR family maltose regulon positive regulatory protein